MKMAMRPRRGKQMPFLPPPQDTDDSDSSEASERSSADDVAMVEVEGQVMAEQEASDDGEEGEDEDDETTRNGNLDEQSPIEEYEPLDLSSDDEVDDLGPPPTPSMNMDTMETQEIYGRNSDGIKKGEYGAIYNELISSLNSINRDTGDVGSDEKFRDVMKKNIEKGYQTFQHICNGITKPDVHPGSMGNRKTAGGAGDLYLAYLHTKESTLIIRQKAERIGTVSSFFSVDKLLHALQREYVDENGVYAPKLAAANIANESSQGSLRVEPLVAAVGSFERETVTEPKVKKARIVQKKQNMDDQHEVSVDSGEGNNQLVESNSSGNNQGPHLLGKEILKILRHEFRNHRPVNLYEYTMVCSSFEKTVENIFNISFLIQKGLVSLTRDDSCPYTPKFSLILKPEKAQKNETITPDGEEETTRNQVHRQKHIVSFSKEEFLMLRQTASGRDTIPFYLQNMPNNELEMGSMD